MESTGVYWRPVYHVLEGSFELLLVNAQPVKRLRGRKTDVAPLVMCICSPCPVWPKAVMFCRLAGDGAAGVSSGPGPGAA